MAILPHVLTTLGTLPSPGGRPQPLAIQGDTLWVGCWDSLELFATEKQSGKIIDRIGLPGKPYGLAWFNDALHIVISIGEEDDRYLYRYVPGTPLTDEERILCPDATGSHLTTDGTALYLVQQSNRCILRLHEDITVARTIALPTRCGGLGFENDTCYMIAADADFDVLEFAKVDISGDTASLEILAPMHVEARGLTFDAGTWWTSHRELDEISNFRL